MKKKHEDRLRTAGIASHNAVKAGPPRSLCDRVYVGPGQCCFLDRALAENDEIRRRIAEVLDYGVWDIGPEHGKIKMHAIKLLSALAEDHACTWQPVWKGGEAVSPQGPSQSVPCGPYKVCAPVPPDERFWCIYAEGDIHGPAIDNEHDANLWCAALNDAYEAGYASGQADLGDTLREKDRQINGLLRFKASVDEALNSGDGSYRP